MPGTCHDCGQKIIFVRLRNGGVMPCDPVVDDRGNVQARRKGAAWIDGTVINRKRQWTAEAGYSLLMPHKATCGAAKRPTNPRPPAPPPTLFEAVPEPPPF